MRLANFILDVQQALEHALEQGLPPIKHRRAHRPAGMNFVDYKKRLAAGTLAMVTVEVRPGADDCDIYVFPQTWASRALGLGGLGGEGIRRAYTVVVMCHQSHTAAIYFGGQHAYNVDLTDEAVRRQLDADIQRRQVASRAEAMARYRPADPATPSPAA